MSNLTAEQEILGTILNYPQIIWGVAASLQFKYFKSDQNRTIFSAIHKAAAEGREPDYVEVETRIDQSLHPYLASLRKLTLKQRAFQNRADQIKNGWVREQVAYLANQMIAEAKSGDPRAIIGKFTDSLSDLAISDGGEQATKLLSDLLTQSKGEYEKRKTNPEAIGTPTGYAIHDLLRRGLRPYRYVIVAARPSVGKTTFAVNCAVNAAQHPTKPLVIMYSVEMRNISIADRITCAEARVDTEKFGISKLSDVEEKACDEARERLGASRFYIEDGKEEGSSRITLTLERIQILTRQLINKEKAYRLANNLPADFHTIVVVDYLQNIHSEDPSIENNSEPVRITKISESLKNLVNATGVHLIAISQLNREGDSEEPTMKHLAQSGNIEYQADDILLMHNRKEQPFITKFKLVKQREGPLGEWDLHFVKPFSLFQNAQTVALPAV